MQITELSNAELDEIFQCKPGQLFDNFEFYPLASPGMPVPGPNFLTAATVWATEEQPQDWWLRYLYLCALYDDACNMGLPVDVGLVAPAPLSPIPGHLWGGAVTGPILPAITPRVMIVGKMPCLDDHNNRRNFTGEIAQLLRNLLADLGLSATELNNIYVTNAVRWYYRNPKSDVVPTAWIKDCLPLLHQELRLIKPDIILCLGSEATKAVLGNKVTLKSMLGQVREITLPTYKLDEAPEYHTIKVMAITNPGVLRHAPEQTPFIQASLSQFVELVRGGEVTSRLSNIEIQLIKDEETLCDLIDLILAPTGIKKIAVDLEWDQAYPTEPDAYVRTVQLSHTPEYAAVIKLHEAGGAPAFKPNINAAITQLKRLFVRDDVQIGGAHFTADIPWLESLGIPAAEQFKVPDDIIELNGGNYAGGFDVAVAEHAHNEAGPFGLKELGVLRCNAEPWNVDLDKWIDEYIKVIKIKRKDLSGYGVVPDEILVPYGGYDAAITRKAMDVECELLNSDKYGANCWGPYHITMRALPAFLEMHMSGIQIDKARVDELTDLYMNIRETKLQAFREKIRWPEFNPRSFPQTVELLFGEEYTQKFDKTGKYICVRPRGAVSFKLTPIKSTSDQQWSTVVAKQEQANHRPCTDQETCGILAGQHPLVGELRDIKFIDHILKSILRVPVGVDNNGYVYNGGIGAAISYDKRVRSTWSPLKETGRAGSSRFPLQNLAKRREAAYARVAGAQYKYPIRSILCASPGYLLMEVDFQSAELFVEGILARDEKLISHCYRAQLPPNDPNFYDIHSNIAVLAFNLTCDPTPTGLKGTNNIHLRVGAKNVIFGALYDRGAEAIARQCQEEGVDIDTAAAERIKSTIFELYSNIPEFQAEIRARPRNPGWLQNPFGRRRRFYPTHDEQVLSSMAREALNFPPQSTVADAISTALYYLKHHPLKLELGYRILSQIHDAALLEVPIRNVDIMYDQIIPECFHNRVSFKACDLNGVPYANSLDYQFGLDIAVNLQWGVKLTKEDCERLTIDNKYAN